MNKEDSKVQLEDLFEVSPVKLQVDTVIPFDCFIHLKLNNRIIWWLREGDVFTAERKDKLLKLMDSNLYARKTQQKVFQQYSEGILIVTGRDVEKEEPLIIFGGKTPRPPKTIIIGGSGEAEKFDKAAAKPRFKVDAEFINAVITSTIEVFLNQFSISITSKTPTRRRAGAKGAIQMDIASFIGLTSQGIRGTIGLCFPTDTYLYLLREASGQNYRVPLPEYCLGCAEFMNMIFEWARPKLMALGYNIDQALPILVAGTDLPVPMIIPDPGFSIVFESPGGPFQFEVGIKTGV